LVYIIVWKQIKASVQAFLAGVC